MATTLTENIISKPNKENEVFYSTPSSVTASETFVFNLNNSNDDFYIIFDTSAALPGNYTIAFLKGTFPTAKTPAAFTCSEGFVYFIPMESGLIEGENSTASFTITTDASGGLSTSLLKLALVKKKFVTNY